ncbi:hypothetical protein [Mucilaginibacter sp. 10I4]|uniref:hypothetical protein n=1 Tax=Mucilaginibacter sp. 10I4 TaxID=3048580 RepID=UPI002B222959|nr:hypothetical protein [Mucilaginibacter sp. 10I4]MEB0262870.1 hypothetical protein [Mucilaginibacter sp. 10I4]
MNSTNLKIKTDISEINNFSVNADLHPRVISGANGTPFGVYALSESLKRGITYLEVQQRLNEVFLPEPKSQLLNTFIVKEATNV